VSRQAKDKLIEVLATSTFWVSLAGIAAAGASLTGDPRHAAFIAAISAALANIGSILARQEKGKSNDRRKTGSGTDPRRHPTK